MRFHVSPRTAFVVIFGRCFHSCRLSAHCRSLGETGWFDTWKWGELGHPKMLRRKGLL